MEMIDLTTIGGIVAATMLLVQALKSALANVRYLNALPVALYAMVVAAGLTWLAHGVLGVLPGDGWQSLAVQAVLASLVASGAWEQARTVGKPLRESTTARNRRGLLGLLLVASIASGAACASSRGALVAADDAIHDAIGVARTAGRLVCDPRPDDPKCKAFWADLADVIRDAAAINRAIASDSTVGIPELIGSALRLERSVDQLLPDGDERAIAKERIARAVAYLRAVLGGK